MCHYVFNNSFEFNTVIFCTFILQLKSSCKKKKKKKENGYPARFFYAIFSDNFPLWLTDPLLTIFNVREKEILFYHPLTLYLHCFPYYC